MKKLFLCAAIAVFGFTSVNAQDGEKTVGFSKGDVYGAATLNLGSSKTGDFKENGFTILPCVGFFLTDNFAIGGQLGYSSNKNETGSTTTFESNEFSVGAYGKYFFTPKSQFSFYGKLGVDYLSQDNKTSDVKTTGFSIAAMPGINYFLSECIAIHATFGSLGYSTAKPDFDGAESTNNFGLNLNMKDIGFGILYRF